MVLCANNQLLTYFTMGQLGEITIILPEGNVILLTLLPMDNLFANATICGIGELVNALVLAGTGLKLIFLLLVFIF